MKRIWIGVGILLILLAVGILAMMLTDRQLEGAAVALQQAAETRDWDTATALAQEARRDWKQKYRLMAALADHAVLEQIETGFAQLDAYRRRNAESDHAATCAQLSKAIRHLQDSHKLTWWNLL